MAAKPETVPEWLLYRFLYPSSPEWFPSNGGSRTCVTRGTQVRITRHAVSTAGAARGSTTEDPDRRAQAILELAARKAADQGWAEQGWIEHAAAASGSRLTELQDHECQRRRQASEKGMQRVETAARLVLFHTPVKAANKLIDNCATLTRRLYKDRADQVLIWFPRLEEQFHLKLEWTYPTCRYSLSPPMFIGILLVNVDLKVIPGSALQAVYAVN